MANDGLKNRCKLSVQDEDNDFVGVRVNVDKAEVYFPFGFQISENDEEIRKDILLLLNIINEFKDKLEGIVAADNRESLDIVNFPLNSYLEIISYFMENGYYTERENAYNSKTRGKVCWPRTIKKQKPLLQDNGYGSFSPIYTNFIVKEITQNIKTELSYINMHCVHESFVKLGWLFTSYVPPKPRGILDKEQFLPILYKKLSNTFNDSEKRLFQAMVDILEKRDNYNNENRQFFGTRHFAHVWENLIDEMFGIHNKKDYYPRTQWNLLRGGEKPDLKYPLQPDTIMECNNRIYVIDAKYYKYGYTLNTNDLPKSADVNKQITYAEFVQNNKNIEDKFIYNAFLMPFNKNDNLFNSDDEYLNIGEVIGDWKRNNLKYEHVQGILVDIKYLMNHYKGNKNYEILRLAKIIEEAYDENMNLNSV